MIRSGKIYLALQLFLNFASVDKLCAPVAGDGLDQLWRKARGHSDNGVFVAAAGLCRTGT